MTDVHEQLELLAIDLYGEGYQCGINDQRWYTAWARVMNRVAHGEPYTDDMVLSEFNKVEKGL